MNAITFQSMMLCIVAVTFSIGIVTLYRTEKRLFEVWHEMVTELWALRSLMDKGSTCVRDDVADDSTSTSTSSREE